MGKERRAIEQSLSLLVKSSIIVFLGVAFSKIVTYLYRIYIFRFFGPEEYGLFSLSLSIISIVVTLSALGFSEGIIRYISIYRKNKNFKKIKAIYLWSIFLSGILSVLAGLLVLVFAPSIANGFFHNDKLVLYLRIFSICVPFLVIGNLWLSLLRSFERIGAYSFLVNVVQNGSKLAALIIFSLIGLRATAVPFSFLLGTMLIFVLSYSYSKRFVRLIVSSGTKSRKIEREGLSSYLHYCWPIIFLTVVNSLFMWADSFVIGYYMDVSSVGYYSVAFSIVALFGIGADIFMQLFFPLIAREYGQGNRKLTEETSKQVTKWIFIINLPLFILIVLFPGAIINLLFGKESLIAVAPLRILAIGGFFSSILVLQTTLLSIKGKSRLILFNLLSTTLLNTILNIILVPRFGLLGAASATSFIWILLTVVVAFQVRNYFSFIPLRRKLIRIFAAAGIASVVLFWLKQYIPITLVSMILLSFFFGIFYLLLVFLLRGMDSYDLQIMNNMKKKLISFVRRAPSKKEETN
ncbi:MAG TPA: flippase [Candidatus Nanoarchaeia archaeon]|nr:flippase [Candidatus Nanoarchaeia archaeon]